MSGGSFNYTQYQIEDIANYIQEKLDNQGKEIPKEMRWCDDDYLEKYPDERFYPTYPEDIQESFREGIKHLKLAYVYAQRIDWFLSGDDGEDSFRRRLKEELDSLKNNLGN